MNQKNRSQWDYCLDALRSRLHMGILQDNVLVSLWDDVSLTTHLFCGTPPIAADGSETHLCIWEAGDYDGGGLHEHDAREVALEDGRGDDDEYVNELMTDHYGGERARSL
jgi:hypothetical protein